MVLSMGSYLHVDGHRTGSGFPFIVLAHLPLLSSGSAARYVFSSGSSPRSVGPVLDRLTRSWRRPTASGRLRCASPSRSSRWCRWYRRGRTRRARRRCRRSSRAPHAHSRSAPPWSCSQLQPRRLLRHALAGHVRHDLPHAGGYAVFAAAPQGRRFVQSGALRARRLRCRRASPACPRRSHPAATRSVLRGWDARYVVVVPGTAGAACATALFDRALGPHRSEGGVSVWSTQPARDGGSARSEQHRIRVASAPGSPKRLSAYRRPASDAAARFASLRIFSVAPMSSPGSPKVEPPPACACTAAGPECSGTTIGVPKRRASMHSRATWRRDRGRCRRRRARGGATGPCGCPRDTFLAAPVPSTPTQRRPRRRRRPHRGRQRSARPRPEAARPPPRAVAQDELVAREPEPVVPVLLGQPVDRHVHADRRRRRPSSPRRGATAATPASYPSTSPEMANTVRGLVRVRCSAMTGVSSSTMTAESAGNSSGQRSSPSSPMPWRSKAPSGWRPPGGPGTRTTGPQRDAGSGDGARDEGQLGSPVVPVPGHDDRPGLTHAACRVARQVAAGAAPQPAAARVPRRRPRRRRR